MNSFFISICILVCLATLHAQAAQMQTVASCKTLVFSSYCPEDIPKVKFGPFKDDEQKQSNHSLDEAVIQKIDSRNVPVFPDYYPNCSAIYMHKLRKAEKRSVYKGKSKFVFYPCIHRLYGGTFADDGTESVRAWMKEQGLEKYTDYFVAVASSNKLSDGQKLHHAYSASAAMKQLLQQSKQEKERISVNLHKIIHDTNYPIGRLLYAILYQSGIDVNKEYDWHDVPLYDALIRKDMVLAKQLLKDGADPNQRNTLHLCESLKAVELLRSYGADVKKQHEEDDLVNSAVYNDDMDSKVLDFFLRYVDLKKSADAEYLHKLCLMSDLEQVLTFNMIAKVELLLKHGCRYDERDFNMLRASARKIPWYTTLPKGTGWHPDSFTKEERRQRKEAIRKSVQQKLTALFKRHPMLPQRNMVHALQQRAITGRSKYIPSTMHKQRLISSWPLCTKKQVKCVA